MDKIFIIDSNILITAKNLNYPLDIMPGFWKQLIKHGASRTVIIDKVREEILRGEDDLAEWILKNGNSFINESSDDIEVLNAYSRIIQDVQDNLQYTAIAKQEFASIADSWICAHALAKQYIVVTQEKERKEAKKRVMIPNVCKDYDIQYISLIEYIRETGITL